MKLTINSRQTLLAIILVLVLFLSACGGNSNTNVSTGDEVKTDPKPVVVDNTPEPTQETIQLKYLAATDKFNPEEDFTLQSIKDLLNVEITPSMGSDSLDKVNLILSSGEDYDAIMLGASQRTAFASYAKNGALQPLNEAIDQFGPELKKAFPQEVWDMVTSDGIIYGIPTTNYSAVTEGILIRKDWLDKLSIAMPTTAEEFHMALKAFKDQDPGGVGNKLVPFAMAGDSGIGANGLAQAFGIGKNPTSWVESDGKIQSSMENPGLKDYVQFLNMLYSEKLLDPDMPVLKGPQLAEKVATGNVGAALIAPWDSWAIQAVVDANPDANFEYITAFKGADGTMQIQNTGGLYQILMVPKQSKKANDVVKYANAFLNPEVYTKLILGTEGSSYKIEDGKYYPIFPEFDKFNKGRWFFPTNEASIYTPLFAARARKEAMMGKLFDDINEKNKDIHYSDPLNFAPTFESVQQYGQQLEVLVKDRLVKMVLVSSEIEKLDALINEWKEKGGDAITKDFNEFYSSKK